MEPSTVPRESSLRLSERLVPSISSKKVHETVLDKLDFLDLFGEKVPSKI